MVRVNPLRVRLLDQCVDTCFVEVQRQLQFAQEFLAFAAAACHRRSQQASLPRASLSRTKKKDKQTARMNRSTTTTSTGGQPTQLDLNTKWIKVFLFHWLRTGGYMPYLAASMYSWPIYTSALLIWYYTQLSHFPSWRAGLRDLTRTAASMIDLHVDTSEYITPTDRRILYTIHDHVILGGLGGFHLGGHDMWSGPISSKRDGKQGVSVTGPAVAYMPLYRETGIDYQQGISQQYTTAATPENIRTIFKSGNDVAIVPGGFGEAVYSGTGVDTIYLRIRDRKGFVKQAILNQADLAPICQWGPHLWYKQPQWCRRLRATIAQRWYIPMVCFFGRYGTSLPNNLDVKHYTWVGPPFSTRDYTVEQVDDAHTAYMDHVLGFYRRKIKEAGLETKVVLVGPPRSKM